MEATQVRKKEPTISGWQVSRLISSAVEYLLKSRETQCMASSPVSEVSSERSCKRSNNLTTARRHAILRSERTIFGAVSGTYSMLGEISKVERKHTLGDIHWRRLSRITKRAGLFFRIVKVSVRLQTLSQRPQYLILIRWIDGPEKRAIKVASICIDELISTTSNATSVLSVISLRIPIIW